MQSNNKNKFNYILHASTRETLQTQELGIVPTIFGFCVKFWKGIMSWLKANIWFRPHDTIPRTKVWYISKRPILHLSVKFKIGTKNRSISNNKKVFLVFTVNWSFLDFLCGFKEVKNKKKISRQSSEKMFVGFFIF